MAIYNLSNVRESVPQVPGGAQANPGTIDIGLYYDSVAQTLLMIDNSDGSTVATIAQPKTTVAVAAGAAALFATAPYIAYPIGTVISLTNYKATGFGMTVQKTSLAHGDRTDWIIIATEAKASTGNTGESPVA